MTLTLLGQALVTLVTQCLRQQARGNMVQCRSGINLILYHEEKISAYSEISGSSHLRTTLTPLRIGINPWAGFPPWES